MSGEVEPGGEVVYGEVLAEPEVTAVGPIEDVEHGRGRVRTGPPPGVVGVVRTMDVRLLAMSDGTVRWEAL